MANVIYPKYKEALLSGAAHVDLTGAVSPGDIVKATLIDGADYTYAATHQFMDTTTVPTVARVSVLSLSGTRTVTNGVFNTSTGLDTFSTVNGDPSEVVIIWIDTGTPATSRLVAYIDGLSVTPNGNDIICDWPVPIFTL